MIEKLNSMDEKEFEKELWRCCGSKSWVRAVAKKRPFKSKAELYKVSESVWFGLAEADWLEAFSHHPRIGDIDTLTKKFASTSDLASREQSGVSGASDAVLTELARKNDKYFNRFGFIFLVCATGKSAAEMLITLNKRLENDEETEMTIAAGEQSKITKLRLEKLLA